MLLRGAFYRIGAVPAMSDTNGRNEKDGDRRTILHGAVIGGTTGPAGAGMFGMQGICLKRS